MGCSSVCTFRGSGTLCSTAPLPPPSAGPGSPTRLADQSPLGAGRVTMAPLPPRYPEPVTEGPPRRTPCVLPTPFSWRRWGSAGKQASNDSGGAGSRGCCSWVLGCRAERESGKPRTAGLRSTPRAPDGRELCTRACRAPDPASRRPRLGRAARGFHGDGKQASTASATTAKFPAFHPPLGAQRDDRGAGCEERERGDSEPEPQKIAHKLV